MSENGQAETKSTQKSPSTCKWTALTPENLNISPERLQRWKIPQELVARPADLVLAEKLAQIVNWSVRRNLPKVLEPVSLSPPNNPVEPLDGQPLQDPPPKVKREFSVRDFHYLAEAISTQQDESQSAGLSSDAPKSNTSSPNLTSRITSAVDLERRIILLKGVKDRVFPVKIDKSEEPQGTDDAETGERLPENATKTDVAECTCCFDEWPRKRLLALSCTHTYCKPCLKTLILTAMQNESSFPPKCCLSEIPLRTILIPLTERQRQDYMEKATEYATPATDRWYCPNTECLKFIHPSKLGRRRSSQKCPHCASKICSLCRGAAHGSSRECPQDYGLEATLEIAESEGWRRCYSCRAMVELSTGCRHITCKCGAEFCYVCGAKWRTCGCTEQDRAVRQDNLRRQRDARNMQAAEAEAIARAIAEVEAMERREAEQEAERAKLEEEALARLEQERQEEEIKRVAAQEEAEKRLREVLRLSIAETAKFLNRQLQEITDHQRILLDDNHGKEEANMEQRWMSQQRAKLKDAEMLFDTMCRNVERRKNRLIQNHAAGTGALKKRHEEQEDDMFLQMQIHLRGKPNREAREQRMQEELNKQLKEECEELLLHQMDELDKLHQTSRMEIASLRHATSSHTTEALMLHKRITAKLREHVAADRKWFELVINRRKLMIEEHCKLMLADLDAGRDPVGLTEALAIEIDPLPPLQERRDSPTSSKRISSPYATHAADRNLVPLPLKMGVPRPSSSPRPAMLPIRATVDSPRLAPISPLVRNLPENANVWSLFPTPPPSASLPPTPPKSPLSPVSGQSQSTSATGTCTAPLTELPAKSTDSKQVMPTVVEPGENASSQRDSISSGYLPTPSTVSCADTDLTETTSASSGYERELDNDTAKQMSTGEAKLAAMPSNMKFPHRWTKWSRLKPKEPEEQTLKLHEFRNGTQIST